LHCSTLPPGINPFAVNNDNVDDDDDDDNNNNDNDNNNNNNKLKAFPRINSTFYDAIIPICHALQYDL